MSARTGVAADLARSLRKTKIVDPTPEFEVDGLTPSAVVRPRDAEGVAKALAVANEQGLAVIPMGGRNHVQTGNLPSRYDIALDLTALNKVVEFEPADLTITVGAGMTMSELRKVTADAKLLAPFDPLAPDSATVGGMISSASFGAAATTLGTPRDFTIGLRVVTADGRQSRAGGKVVKNVAGYDLCKLYTGSRGALGVMVEASLKVIPAPPVERLVEYRGSDAASACRVARYAARLGLSIRSASVHHDPSGWRGHILLAGTSAGVERSHREIMAIADLQDADASSVIPWSVPVEAMISVLPSALPDVLERASSLVEDGQVEGWPREGVCLARTDSTAAIAPLLEVAGEFGGTMTVMRCPAGEKAHFDVFGEPPSTLPLMQRIKREFDPRSTLSPGRGPGRI